MQIQGIGKSSQKEYRGWGKTCKHIYKHLGIRGFGRGITTCVVRDVPSFAAFFITYEWLVGKPNVLKYKGDYGIGSVNEISDLGKILKLFVKIESKTHEKAVKTLQHDLVFDLTCLSTQNYLSLILQK